MGKICLHFTPRDKRRLNCEGNKLKVMSSKTMVKCSNAVATEKLRWGGHDWLMSVLLKGKLALPNSMTIECFCSHGKLEWDGEGENLKKNEYSIPFVLPPPCIFIPLSTWEYLTYAWRCQLWWVRLLLPRREWREVCHGNHSELGPPVSLWKKKKSLSKLDPHFTNPQRVGWNSPSLLFLLFSLHKAPQNPAAANWLLPVQQPMGKDWASFAAC